MNKNILLIMSAFLLVFTLFSVSAMPDNPFTQSNNNIVGLTIEIPYTNVYYDTDYNLHAHVYNNTDGLIIANTNYSCFLHLYNNDGHVLQVNMTNDINGFDKEYNINGTLLVKDYDYYSVVTCDSNGLGGFLGNVVELVDNPNSDNKLNLNLNDTNTLIILGLLILSILVLVFFGQFLYSGVLTMIVGFIFMFSSGNYLLSSFIIVLGLGQFGASK